MKKLLTPFAAAPLAALLTLAGCGEPETITADDEDPQAEALKNAAPIEAPPMIQASRTYRCKDNSLLYVDFYTNNTARVRTEKEGTPTTLTAANGQPPYTAQGWSISANASQVNITAPGKGSQSCKA
jgi:predicted small lipoprotein YifL